MQRKRSARLGEMPKVASSWGPSWAFLLLCEVAVLIEEGAHSDCPHNHNNHNCRNPPHCTTNCIVTDTLCGRPFQAHMEERTSTSPCTMTAMLPTCVPTSVDDTNLPRSC